MAGGDFIDLLSSDEEPAPNLPPSKPTPKPPSGPTNARTALHPKYGFFYQSDEFDNTVHLDDNYAAQPMKRRKLSPSPRAEPLSAGLSTAETNGAAKKVTKYSTNWTDDGFAVLDDEDAIMFTSSANGDAMMTTSCSKMTNVDDIDIWEEESDGNLPENIFDSSLQLSKKTSERSQVDAAAVFGAGTLSSTGFFAASDSNKGSSILSTKTKILLASLSTESGIDGKSSGRLGKTLAKAARNRTGSKPASKVRGGSEDTDEGVKGPSQNSKQAKKSRPTEEEKAKRANEKEREKEARVREKERAKERKTKEKEDDLVRKRLMKEEKAKQKQKEAEIAEVNKAKLDKKDSTPEMIVDLPASLNGQRVETLTREFLKNLDVETSLYQSHMPNVIKWRRKVKAKWSTEEGRWEPLPQMQIEDEKHIICIMPGAEFISLATAQDDEEDVETHVAKLRTAYPDCIPIYLIEGLTKKMREIKTAANRKYQHEVLSQGQIDGARSSRANKRKKPSPVIVDEDVIEDALLRLQVMNDCLIHHTAFYVETAEWIATFTQHISTVPYKLQRLNLATTFCMEPGQIKTGEDKSDTYFKMLQEVVRVTPPIAQAIVDAYPTVLSLVKAFRENGPLILQDLQKAANRNGGLSERNVGKAISKRLYEIFTGMNPTSTRV